jgi:hypothetical protein
MRVPAITRQGDEPVDPNQQNDANANVAKVDYQRTIMRRRHQIREAAVGYRGLNSTSSVFMAPGWV